MAFDHTCTGRTAAKVTSTYDWRNVALYALGVGAGTEDLAYVLDDPEPKVLPTFGVIPSFEPVHALLCSTGGNMVTLLHSGQRTELLRPFPPRGEMTTTAAIRGIFDMKIGKLLRFLSGYYPTWDPDLVNDLVAKFALDPAARSDRLSKGEGTRLRLVMAMAFKPQLLLLDEPATGLDLKGRRALLEEVLGIVRDPERTVVVSSHDLADLERIADRLVVFHKGRVVREGNTCDLLGDDRTLEEALLTWGAA